MVYRACVNRPQYDNFTFEMNPAIVAKIVMIIMPTINFDRLLAQNPKPAMANTISTNPMIIAVFLARLISSGRGWCELLNSSQRYSLKYISSTLTTRNRREFLPSCSYGSCYLFIFKLLLFNYNVL